MTCACSKNKGFQYIWTSDDQQTTIVYTSEIVAKARVKRKGGSYIKQPA